MPIVVDLLDSIQDMRNAQEKIKIAYKKRMDGLVPRIRHANACRIQKVWTRIGSLNELSGSLSKSRTN